MSAARSRPTSTDGPPCGTQEERPLMPLSARRQAHAIAAVGAERPTTAGSEGALLTGAVGVSIQVAVHEPCAILRAW